ncbi:hypothetical protein V6R21_29785 [Limibacter armeniacum]|uniref:hypothetical protein n=1 Tax=Limibacter armeniacum TaxID=466084 RepID=UPI002FE6B17C
MEEQKLTTQTQALVLKHMQLPAEELLGDKTAFENLEALKEQLSKLISRLLDHDFGRLMNAMYRIDIKEHDFKEAMSLPTGKDIADRIATLIVERELQKVKFRMQYSSGE